MRLPGRAHRRVDPVTPDRRWAQVGVAIGGFFAAAMLTLIVDELRVSDDELAAVAARADVLEARVDVLMREAECRGAML